MVIKEEKLASVVIETVPAFPSAPPQLETPSAPKETGRRLRKPYKARVKKGPQTQPVRQWMQLKSRPYLSAADREAVQNGSRFLRAKPATLGEGPAVFHVDFTAAEVAQIINHVAPFLPVEPPRTILALKQLCDLPISTLVEGKLSGRTEQDVRNFCSDVLADKAADLQDAKILSLSRKDTALDKAHHRAARVSSLLFARELAGSAAGMGHMRHYVNFQASLKQSHEDAMRLTAEFTNCAGDVSTMTWIPDQNILCGTTAHSDAHNQQYNKPGNLLLCSTSLGVLRAFPDHRIPRPIVSKGENSLAAMRQSQDPWIYSSVVSSDYDAINGFAYTSSFDKTIKAWKIDKNGGSMEAVATFQLDGNVNFVVAAKDGSGRVAAAADATSEAIRIYTMDPDNMVQSSYYTISCTRNDAHGSDKWAYFPATVQWGIAPGTQHLLLVGYSPRSFSNDEQDIPAEKLNTGEIMLWDALNRCQVPVLTATTANVFEVAWHPTVCGFVVGTSPCGLKVDQGVRTQIHVFRQDWAQHPDGAYSEYQKLDCFASDINEVTIHPNSPQSSYITAACTDGKVYVWDMAQGDKPIHVLRHGEPIDEVGDMRPEDREREDTGVKFTAWGNGLDRLYTGSSDGVVKVWNVRNRRKPFVRDLLRAPGPISCGSFSPDKGRLAVGDATGRLFLFSVSPDDEDEALEEDEDGEQYNNNNNNEKNAALLSLPPGDPNGRRITRRRPKPFTPHPEPPPPPPPPSMSLRDDPDGIMMVNLADQEVVEEEEEEDANLDAATYARRKFLDTQQLTIHGNPVIGAVQGPMYAATGLFLRDAHLDDDPALPLVTRYERLQQASRHSVPGSGGSGSEPPRRRRRSMHRLKDQQAPHLDPDDPATAAQHAANLARELNLAVLRDSDLQELIRAGALLDIGREGEEGEDWGFVYEDGAPAGDDEEEEGEEGGGGE